jgi:hypothetical protein
VRAVSREVPGAIGEQGAAASAEVRVIGDGLVGDGVVGCQAVGPVLLQVAQRVLAQTAGKRRHRLSAVEEGEGLVGRDVCLVAGC